MRIDQLLSFKAVADERSYTRAADKRFLTQSAIYSQVRQLEAQCGTGLFHVSGKEVLLTEEGRDLYTFASAVAAEYDDYRKRVETRASERRTVVRIGALSHLSALTEAGKRLLATDPSVVIEFQSYHAREALDLIRREELDFGFYGPAVTARDLVFEQCGECRISIIAPPSHPLAGREIDFSELTRFPLVGYAGGSARSAIDAWLEAHPGSEIRYVAQADTSGATKTLAIRVNQAAFVIREAVMDELLAGTLAEVHVRDFHPSFPLFVVYLGENQLGIGARRYLAILREMFSSTAAACLV